MQYKRIVKVLILVAAAAKVGDIVKEGHKTLRQFRAFRAHQAGPATYDNFLDDPHFNAQDLRRVHPLPEKHEEV